MAQLGRRRQVMAEIWGEGPDRPLLERMIAEFGLNGVVRLRGKASEPQLAWRENDVAVVPSAEFVESFGRSAVEAMACGKPVIASRNGGLTEIVAHGRTGWLIEPGSPEALVEAILRYRQNPELIRSHGEAGRRRCEARFDLAESAEAYLDLMNQLVAESPR